MELHGRVTGVALFPGIVDGTTRHGVLLVGRSVGAISGGWLGMVHYTPPQVVAGAHHTIVGGRWAAWARDLEGRRGLLLGRVLGGAIERDASGLLARVALEVSVQGGLGGYRGRHGNGKILELMVDHRLMPPRLVGELHIVLAPFPAAR